MFRLWGFTDCCNGEYLIHDVKPGAVVLLENLKLRSWMRNALPSDSMTNDRGPREILTWLILFISGKKKIKSSIFINCSERSRGKWARRSANRNHIKFNWLKTDTNNYKLIRFVLAGSHGAPANIQPRTHSDVCVVCLQTLCASLEQFLNWWLVIHAFPKTLLNVFPLWI